MYGGILNLNIFLDKYNIISVMIILDINTKNIFIRLSSKKTKYLSIIVLTSKVTINPICNQSHVVPPISFHGKINNYFLIINTRLETAKPTNKQRIFPAGISSDCLYQLPFSGLGGGGRTCFLRAVLCWLRVTLNS